MDSQIWRPTKNEKDFVLSSLKSGLRVDGRSVFDYRHLTIRFTRSDGSTEVQLGSTRVLACVSANLVVPHDDRPQEGKILIHTQSSAMGVPEDYILELNQALHKGIRKSKALDLENLCVVPGIRVWEVRVDIHILDNGGNLIDAANIATVAALCAFKRPDCTVGEDGKKVTMHDPEVRDPVPLILHHLPIALTFAYSSDGNILVLDPTFKEEAVMGGKITVFRNLGGEIFGIQKPGGAGITTATIMDCLRIAAVKASDLTMKINNAVESYNREKALGKVRA